MSEEKQMTPLNQLLKICLEHKEKEVYLAKTEDDNGNLKGASHHIGSAQSYHKLILEIQSLLPKEKQGIIEANIAGMEFIPVDPKSVKKDAEQYFNSKYTQ